MARVLALIPDLLFGSHVQSALVAAGLEVELVGDRDTVQERLADAAVGVIRVLVVDLTNAELDGPGLVESLSAENLLDGARTLGFYAHVDIEVRERAERAGFDLVVPRSRMAREGAALVEGLLAGPAGT